jgi:indolepyruvate ferredoxin oxidoreductase alpha subunit
VLPPEQARRVVSVIGDSTFVHSGITGLVEMVYNPPPTGHVPDSRQRHHRHDRACRSIPAPAARSTITRPARWSSKIWRARWASRGPRHGSHADPDGFPACCVIVPGQRRTLPVIIARRDCLLAAGKIKSYRQYEKCNAEQA